MLVTVRSIRIYLGTILIQLDKIKLFIGNVKLEF